MLSVQPGLRIAVSHEFSVASGSPDAQQSGAFLSATEWETLLKSSASDVVFMTWQWQRLWWEYFGAPRRSTSQTQPENSAEDCKLHLLAVRDEEGALVGIAPLFISASPLPPPKEYVQGELRPEGEGAPVRAVRIVGGIDIADYLDIIASKEHMADVWALVLDYLLERRGDWDVIDFHSLPAFSPSREILPQLAQERGLLSQVFAEDVSPVSELTGDWDAFLMSLRKKDRHELRRKVRKLEGRDDVKWSLVPSRDAEALQEGMKTFLDLHRMSGADKAEFMDEYMADFFMKMARDLADTGWLDLAILEVNKQPASAYLSFAYGDRIYLYNSGYSQEFASYSAGVALLAYRIHKAILQGYRYFDFLRGDEPYKYDFGAKDTFVYRAMIT